ncbi:MAG TPA: alpha/beta fold hydrolase [Ktedonobacterales bacterium]|jgi:3-oxoadipate enol-lactonase|nr:alpha/beta fold hydrolase [Ktedonobacterales bacterium]
MSASTNGETGYAEINGARLYYEIAGAGQPLVLLHAGIADSRMWDDQFAVFAQRYKVIRYDHRGFGKSSMPPGPYVFREDLLGLLRHLGIARASLIGVSMGGRLAVDFTLEHPEMVEALIPVCAGLSGFEPNPSEIAPEELAYWEQLEAADKASDAERLNELEVHLWVDGLRRAPERVNPAVRARVREMNAANIARAAEQEQAQSQPLQPPATGRLGEIHAPTLVIVGAEDNSTVQTAVNRLATEIPGAKKVVMRDTAHVPNMEKPEEFNRIVLEFLASLG